MLLCRRRRIRQDVLRHWHEERWPDLAAVVSCVAAQEHKRIWVNGRADQATQVADAVSRAIDEVEGSVLEVVEGGELANLEDTWRAFFKGDLVYISASGNNVS